MRADQAEPFSLQVPVIEGVRRLTVKPEYYEWFEYLYEEYQKETRLGSRL